MDSPLKNFPHPTAARRVIAFLLSALLLAACSQWASLRPTGAARNPSPTPRLSVPLTRSAPLPTRAVTPAPTPADWYQLFFTRPDDPGSASLRGGPDAALAQAIRSARLSVDLAVLDLNLWSVRDALLEAGRGGATVRVVVDSDYIQDAEIQDLILAGIPVMGDGQNALMHDKFVVIDRQEVWTGSMNYTLNDAYRNYNNLVRIRSTGLAEDYTVEFEEMFVEQLFGAASRPGMPHPTLQLGGAQLEVYFSPDDGTAARLVELLNAAQESIYFLAYSFTADDLGSAILDRAAAGVTVAGVMDAAQAGSNQGTEYTRFRRAGLEVLKDGSPGNLHHKVLIIDRRIVVTGSYNFSRNAEQSNDENTLIIHDPGLAARFMEEFERIFAAAQNK